MSAQEPQPDRFPTLHQEPIPFLTNPLVVELLGGRRVLVHGNSDIDGTLINEHVPERDKIPTIAPARAAVTELESVHHIPVGVSTSRSFGEALYYQEAANGHGVTICEDGAVISLGKALRQAHIASLETRGYSVVTREGRSSVILSRTPMSNIERFLDETQKQSDESLFTSLTTPIEQLQELLGHPTLDQTRMSVDRLASVYIVNASQRQKEIMNALAPQMGLRTFGEPVHIMGADAQKGTPLEVMNALPTVFFSDLPIQGVLPIFFGNRENDIPSLATAIKMGGIGVLVGHPDGGHYIETDLVPPEVIKTTKPYGFGIQEAIPVILEQLESKIQI